VNAPAYKFLPPELAGRLRGLGVSVRRPVEGAMQGLHRSPNHGSSVEFADYREYARGDPPNSIDWAIYARSDRYVIRRYQEETNVRAHLLLDISESMAFREAGLHSKMDYACYLAAALMLVLAGQSDSAGLTLFNEDIRRTFPPAGSLNSLRPLLLALEEIKTSGRSQIEQALHQTAERIQRRSLVILISDLLQEPAGIIRGIQHLRHNKHEVLILQILDAGEMDLSFGGLAELRELETGARLPVEAGEIRAAYAREVSRFLDEIRRGCAASLADYHLIDTRTPVEQTLYAKFGQL
jgi:uncharacterized protein (DUF58 family)